ncbi:MULTISPECIES: hypothetical protein [unclassified Ensifer]|uniref:hypothetical protein n=1 Tax=unclassified Ensifer TaxID=2633371 RepID=UPI001FCDB765|nr:MULTISPECIES: hypothetical protein [unclassified Ensifer]
MRRIGIDIRYDDFRPFCAKLAGNRGTYPRPCAGYKRDFAGEAKLHSVYPYSRAQSTRDGRKLQAVSSIVACFVSLHLRNAKCNGLYSSCTTSFLLGKAKNSDLANERLSVKDETVLTDYS